MQNAAGYPAALFLFLSGQPIHARAQHFGKGAQLIVLHHPLSRLDSADRVLFQRDALALDPCGKLCLRDLPLCALLPRSPDTFLLPS